MADPRQDLRTPYGSMSRNLSRRTFLGLAAGAVTSALLAACRREAEQAGPPAPGQTPGPSPTPAAAQTAGPSPAPAEPTPRQEAVRGVEIPKFDNPPPGRPSGSKPEELVIAWGVNQLTTYGIDPQRHVGTVAESQLRHMYEPLVAFDRDLQTIVPALATSWERIDDLTIQFKLRQGVKFHNGEPFNAEAVRYSILRPLSDETPGASRSTYAVIEDVEIIDDYTVNIKTSRPDPALLARLTGFHMTIVAPKWASQGPEVVSREANGTGPYRLVSWSPNEDLVLEANEEYWGDPPEIKRVRLVTITEQATRVSALRAGDVHVATAMPPEEIASINASGRARALRVVGNRVPFYFITIEVPPYNDKRVRQAINYAANVQGVIDAILLGNGYRIATVLPIWAFGYDPTLEPYPHDPEKAKQLLAEAGYPNGIDIKIWYIQGRYPKDKEVAEAMAQEMAKANIRCTPELREAATLTDMQKNKETPGLVFASWGNWFFDADNTFFPLFSCAQAKDYNFDWRRPYCNEEFDKIIQAARVEMDVEKRRQLYAEAQRFFYDDAGALFMYQLVDIYGVNNWVLWEPRNDEMIWAHEMKWNE